MAESITNSLGMVLRRIEAGTFRMGSTEPPAKWDEQPVHRVVLTRSFFISEEEVTAEQFRQFRPEFDGTEAFLPFVAGVSWYDAVAFCQWLSAREGVPYRLPTEAEWEYACRTGRDDTEEADAPRVRGLRNMLHGAREWCLDWYGEYPDGEQSDPVGPDKGIARVIRGGGLDRESERSREADYARPTNRASVAPGFGFRSGSPNDFGRHGIGFRVVQAPMPETEPTACLPSFVQRGVRKSDKCVDQGPDPRQPYIRKRYLLPTPPENAGREVIDAAGFHPSFRGHNHSPALEVCPNGDVLLVSYTSYTEYEPEVSLLASRLRFGAEEWDMPSPFFDFANVNDHAPLLWNDGGTLHFFWGNPRLDNAYPFQWASSVDSGATWSEVRFPNFVDEVGPHSKQPINTAFRGADGTIYVASDGEGGSSVLWASRNDGETWCDTGGRSAGRHTAYSLLADGRILGMGGKNTEIDGYMPKVVSDDGGKTWEVSRTPFCRLGSNQRPCLLRLQSGRLLFCGDFQHLKDGFQPEGIGQRGAYVALSEDEGENWVVRKLAGAQVHENPKWAEIMRGGTLGYSVARQAPNGLIHLITTMNEPCLHFELNEAWILAEDGGEIPEEELRASQARSIADVREYREEYPEGGVRSTWSAGIADGGRYLLHGAEIWHHENGQKEREATYDLGCKVGTESYWSPEGQLMWRWEHGEDGRSVWTQWWPDGRMKARSGWVDFHCDGEASCWDRSGELVSQRRFVEGRMVD